MRTKVVARVKNDSSNIYGDYTKTIVYGTLNTGQVVEVIGLRQGNVFPLYWYHSPAGYLAWISTEDIEV